MSPTGRYILSHPGVHKLASMLKVPNTYLYIYKYISLIIVRYLFIHLGVHIPNPLLKEIPNMFPCILVLYLGSSKVPIYTS